MNDKFTEAELKGRALFKSFLDLIGATGLPTEDTYDRVDYYYQYKDKKVVAEIKVRNAYYPDYLIEVPKLKALIQKKKDLGLDGGLYVCFYENQMYIFGLSTILSNGTRLQMYLKGTTVEDSGYRWKDVILVPTVLAKRYDLKDGRWVKYEED